MTILRRFLAIVAIGALVVGIGFSVLSRGPEQTQRGGRRFSSPEGPVPVTVTEPRVEDVPVYIEGVGTTRALNMVTVRSQVDGTLISINFREGQDVKRGDILARIDPTTYQALLDQAVAKKALDEATLTNAKLDLERYTNLVKTNAITRQQLDTQRATVAQLEAQVRLDQGAIDNAQALRNYCSITAPFDGRVGIRLVDPGNLIHASDLTGIVILTQLRPIAVLFSVAQQQLPRINKAFATEPLRVEAISSDNKMVLDHGVLQVVNNQVDQTTGTVQLKAEFPNSDLQLWPGQFINARLLIGTLHQALVVPSAAVQRGPKGAFVYVLKPDSTVAVQLVTVSQQDEVQAVIANELGVTDRVVTSGVSRLAEGRKVTVASAGETLAPVPHRDGGGQGTGGGGGGGGGRHRNERGTPSEGARSTAQ
jgi:membrane fusion protein, multidrug efflux system